jgi:hypothetical protein
VALPAATVPFEQIASLVVRSPTAARQLASRARRRVRGAPASETSPDPAAQRRIVQAFFAAARDGDLGALMGFTVSGGRIIEIDILLDPVLLRRLDLAAFLLPQAEVGLAVQ